MLVFLFYFVMFLIIVYILDYVLQNATRSSRMFNKIPGPKTVPILGNILEFIRDPIPLFYVGRAMASKYKDIYRIWAFKIKIVNLYDPSDLEVVLSSSKHITKGFIYDFIRPWLNDGLLTSGGEKWHQRRKILTPAFHFNILRDFCTVFMEQSEQMVKQLDEKIEQEVEIFQYINNFALHAICETAMGINLNTVKKEEMFEYKKAIFNIGHCSAYRLGRLWLHSDFSFSLTSLGGIQRKALKILHNFSTKLIKLRRNIRNNSLNNNEKLTVDNDGNSIVKRSRKRRIAMLDLLLMAEEQNCIDELGIREEVDTFMFEGHDTTTMAVTFCLMLLANNQEAQELAYAEVENLLRDKVELTTMETLNRMKYLERCIKEALRLYPSVPFIGRVVNEEVKLSKYTIPSGTVCHMHIFDLHRNPELYPNPEKFDPDRFLKEISAKRHPFAYIPFSAGPRNCIGQKFAILEEKAVISTILYHFKLEPVTTPRDIVFTADMVLRSANSIKIKFSRRTK